VKLECCHLLGRGGESGEPSEGSPSAAGKSALADGKEKIRSDFRRRDFGPEKPKCDRRRNGIYQWEQWLFLVKDSSKGEFSRASGFPGKRRKGDRDRGRIRLREIQISQEFGKGFRRKRAIPKKPNAEQQNQGSSCLLGGKSADLTEIGGKDGRRQCFCRHP